ncbi:hypothetical protein [Emticicia sp. BO119]|uniref:hypothetical protein n=1 Tax=Emticicia sp. BO119 TaxID=2757768 RepID=UPI0015F0DF3A|nr:hypothetical protein [Emticicia sp. BO119]MBA4849375.1 hypothetical protein [Emticicia sp. BO119]
MKFDIYLSSPNVVIIDPLFINKEVVDYFLALPDEEQITPAKAEKINKELFPYGGYIIGFYRINDFIEGKNEIDVSEIIRIFKEDFEEYDLSEECLFGVDSGEILVIGLDFLKVFLEEYSSKFNDDFYLKDLLDTLNYPKSKFRLIEAFDIDNTFTEFTGDGRYLVTENFITTINSLS